MNRKTAPYYYLLVAVLYVFGVACTKHQNSISDNGCISRLVAKTISPTLSSSQIDSINILFSNNNMSTAQLQFLYFTPNVYSDTTKPTQSQVIANLFINGLPMFGNNEAFIFNNGIFDTAYLYNGIPQTNDTTGHQSFSYLRTAFMNHVSESITYMPLQIPPFIPSPKNYIDSCLTATLGYVDASSIPGNQNDIWGSTLIKVWSVSCNNHYPSILVKDDNGLAWGVPVYIP